MKHDTEPDAITRRLVDQLRTANAAARAERLARLADPNTPPDERRMLEVREHLDAQAEAGRIRREAQEREAHQREVQRRFDEHLIEAQRRGRPTRERKRKPDFVRQVKRAQAAGLNIRSASITADGVVVHFGEAEAPAAADATVIETEDELRKLI
jgi:hypothetical protein